MSYSTSKQASKGNAFTSWMDGSPSIFLPKKGTSDSSLCSIAASKAVDKGRRTGKTVDIIYSRNPAHLHRKPPNARQQITLDKTPQASADKQAKMRKAAI